MDHADSAAARPNITEARLTYERLIGRPLACQADGDDLSRAAHALGIKLTWISSPIYGADWQEGRWAQGRSGERREARR